jgi:hypothetical protein
MTFHTIKSEFRRTSAIARLLALAIKLDRPSTTFLHRCHENSRVGECNVQAKHRFDCRRGLENMSQARKCVCCQIGQHELGRPRSMHTESLCVMADVLDGFRCMRKLYTAVFLVSLCARALCIVPSPDVHHHSIKDGELQGDVRIIHCSSSDQMAFF